MPFAAIVYKVFIASPGDVTEERQIIRDVVAEWNVIHSEDRGIVLQPVGWETHSNPEMGDRPQGIINRQVLADCDLLIAAFWTRLGSPTDKAASGTVEEIEEHLGAGKPAMLYFSSTPVRPESIDAKQYEALTQFKAGCYKKGLVQNYDSIQDFRLKVSRQLAQVVIREGWGNDKTESIVEHKPLDPLGQVSEYAQRLLLAAAEGQDGDIMTLRHSEGYSVQVGRSSLFQGHDSREIARWKQAIEQLVQLGLLEPEGYRGEMYALTAEGWEVADRLLKGGSRVNP